MWLSYKNSVCFRDQRKLEKWAEMIMRIHDFNLQIDTVSFVECMLATEGDERKEERVGKIWLQGG